MVWYKEIGVRKVDMEFSELFCSKKSQNLLIATLGSKMWYNRILMKLFLLDGLAFVLPLLVYFLIPMGSQTTPPIGLQKIALLPLVSHFKLDTCK